MHVALLSCNLLASIFCYENNLFCQETLYIVDPEDYSILYIILRKSLYILLYFAYVIVNRNTEF